MENLKCCICGKELPNRYAVAGKCEGSGCDEVFCSLHWNGGNHKCFKHGWKETEKKKENTVEYLRDNSQNDDVMLTTSGEDEVFGEDKKGIAGRLKNVFKNSKNIDVRKTEKEESDDMNENQEKKMARQVSKDKAKKVMTETLNLMKKLGIGASGLFAKISKAKTPEEMLNQFDEQLELNIAKHELSSKKLEQLHGKIVEFKKNYEQASGARKKMLANELKNLMHTYKIHERELNVILENEKILTTVRGRFMEILAYELRGVSENSLETLIDDLEDKVDEADGVQDVLRDLDRIGRTNTGEADEESLDDMLSEFDEDISFSEEVVEISDDVSPNDVPEKTAKKTFENAAEDPDLDDF